MMENELFDVFGRKDKKQGGYMTYLHQYHSPFIFANFNGTSGDVDVITHECGHAFQGYLSGQDPIMEHADITMETAEIHSMSMEFFTDPWMKEFFGDREKDFLSMQLEDAIRFIPYGTMVDEFQHIVYETPELTPQERRREWSRLEKIYMPHLDYEEDPFFSRGDSGRNSSIFTTARFIILTMCWHKAAHSSTRCGWMRITERHGRATLRSADCLLQNFILKCCGNVA